MPLWSIAAGGVLAAIAGYINAVVLQAGLLPVTHLTGSASRLSSDFAQGKYADALLVGGIAGGFVTGSMLVGVLVGGRSLRLGRPYGLALLLESALIALAAILFRERPGIALPIAACAAGVQNGMASSYGRLVLRTTHITGVATDLGLALGGWLRSRTVAASTFSLHLTILGGFFIGGIVGWRIATLLAADALFVPAGCLAVMGTGYLLWRLRVED